MEPLLIGWATTDITPDRNCALAGQFAERISQYVEKPITATAMAIKKGDQQAVFCSCELVSTRGELVEDVREALKDNTVGLDISRVMLNATHVHTGPCYGRTETNKSGFRTQIEKYLPKDKKYVETADINDNPDIISQVEVNKMLVERISAVILKAWASLEPGSFTNAFGRAPIGMCRRAAYTDGSAAMWGTTDTAMFEAVEGGSDSGIELLYVFDEAKALKGIVVNLACPAQCVQHRLFVSPDFWGEARMLLQERFGKDLFILEQCSAAGDQCPVDLVRWVEPETDVNDPNITRIDPKKRKADPSMFDLKGMKLAGRRLASEVIRVYEDGLDEVQEDPEFIHEVTELQLPLRKVTYADVKAAKRAIREYMEEKEGDVNYNDAAILQVYMGIMDREKRQEHQHILPMEAHFIRLGSVAFATNTFELFLDFGNKIKARSKAEQTFLVQLCCGAQGYLPTAKAEKGGHYSAFVSSGTVDHVGGDQLVMETLTHLDRMF